MNMDSKKRYEMLYKKVEEAVDNFECPKWMLEDGVEFLIALMFEEMGIKVDEHIFSWKSEYLSSMNCLYSINIGLRKVEFTKYMTKELGITILANALNEELAIYENELSLHSTIYNEFEFGMRYKYDDSEIKEYSIKDILDILNTNRICDEKFENELIECGYDVKVDERGYKYIDTSKYTSDSKLYLELDENPHTLYRKKVSRPRIEVLYLLTCLYWGENIFSDEY